MGECARTQARREEPGLAHPVLDKVCGLYLETSGKTEGFKQGSDKKKNKTAFWNENPWFGVESKSCGDQLENYYTGNYNLGKRCEDMQSPGKILADFPIYFSEAGC